MNTESKKARLAATIRATRQGSREATTKDLEPIAIVGLSGRLPQASSVPEFWALLDEERVLIESIPLQRFDLTPWYGGEQIAPGKMRTRWGGFIPGIEQFDAEFFGMLPGQARLMDPQLRLLLMSVRDTFEDAGYRHTDWRGSNTGVYIAAERNEYYLNLLQAGVDTGDDLDQAPSMLANRVSHFYDLRGPSERIDAMCAGGAVALHHAVTALRAGTIDSAIVGAANLLLRPDIFVKLSQSGQMSAEPTVHSFGAQADGFLRAEGVCSVLLKPLSRAEADADSIYGLIRSTAINFNGKEGASIAAPSVSAHSRLVQDCYRRAGIDPRHVSYIEAQGMGNPVADIAEWDAINHGLSALAREQGVQLPPGQCAISTLKPMCGHMHAASAFGALFKILRSLHTDRLHPVLGLQQVNPHLHTDGQPCRLLGQASAWPRTQQPRLAGLHSYGAGGNNAHLLIEEYVPPVPASDVQSYPLLFPLSAPNRQALQTYAGQLRQALAETTQLPLAHVSETLRFGRDRARVRVVLVASERTSLLQALAAEGLGQRDGEVMFAGVEPEHLPPALGQWARDWLAGEALAAQGAPARRVHLPPMPFELRGYWHDGLASMPPHGTLRRHRDGQARADVSRSTIERRVRQVLAEALEQAAERIDLDKAFSELGFDSMMVRKLTLALQEAGLQVEPAALFEQATPARLIASLVAEPPDSDSLSRSSSSWRQDRSCDIAIVGMAGTYPQSADLEALWACLAAGRDCIETLPAQRWALDEHFEADRQRAVSEGKSYGCWGGFIDGLHEFDPKFFNLSLAEATYMHPKERQFLQCAWHTLENAGYPPARLAAERVGVYVGVSKAGHDSYKDSFFSVANRVSYRFGFTGPSLPIDTACSSSLTAVHEACLHLQSGECSVALVGGVNAYTHPSTFAEFSRLGVLSSDGRSRAFGEGANGFVPGEGVGALLLKPLARAQADGDRIHGVIIGSAVNHGGKANGYTVPNPQAQRALIRLALDRAGVDAGQVSYVEAHGTGTALGDPIEFRGLVEAFRQDTERAGYCRLGSVKTNIGHLEAAAGIVGLSKILLQMRHAQIAPSLHAQVANPDIDEATSPFRIARELEPWEPVTEAGQPVPRIACVSSFGAGGANAHVVLQQAPDASRLSSSERGAWLILLSARHEAALRRQSQVLLAYLQRHPQLSLEDIAYTLQIGREAMDARLSVVACDLAGLIDALRQHVEGSVGSGVQVSTPQQRQRASLFGDDPSAQAMLEAWYAQEKLAQLAQLWHIGEPIDWQRLAAPGSARMLDLPGYAFDREPIAAVTPLLSVPPRSAQSVASKRPDGVATLLVRPTWRSVELQPVVDRDPVGHVIACHWTGVVPDQGWQCLTAPWQAPEASYPWYVEQLSDALRQMIVARGGQPGAVQVIVPSATAPWLRGLHGLLRSAQLESSKLRTQLVELDPSLSPDALREALALARRLPGQSWLRIDRQGCQARRWDDFSELPASHHSVWKDHGVYLISGGLGGLACIFAQDILASTRQATVVLVGRRAPGKAAQERLQALQQLNGTVVYQQLDITDGAAVEGLVERIRQNHGGLTGVLHCAGVLRDGFLRNLQTAQCEEVLAAKVAGTVALDHATRNCRLDCFVLFSSAAAAVGHPGQAIYAAANGFMDGFAEDREAQVQSGHRHGRTVAVAWGLWREGGMRLDEPAIEQLRQATGMYPLEREQGVAALHQVLAGDGRHVLVIDGQSQRLRQHLDPPITQVLQPGSDDTLRTELRRLLSQVLGTAVSDLEDDQPFDGYGVDQACFNQLIDALNTRHGLELSPLSYRQVQTLEELYALVHAALAVAGSSTERATDKGELQGMALVLLKQALSAAVQWPPERLDSDEPLECFGLDSMMVMNITAALEAKLGTLPKTLFYEYSSLREIADYLRRERGDALAACEGPAAIAEPEVRPAMVEREPASVAVLESEQASQDGQFDVAIIGLAGRYPQARNLDEFWQVLSEGRDCISEIPLERWDHARYYSGDEDAPGKTYARWGGFIDGVDEFDPAFFNISPREAAIMEPQERLFLQAAHEAMEDAGYTRQSLAASASQDGIPAMVGVFVGVTYEEYQLYGAEQTAAGRPLVLSMSPSSIANRVSFVNDFHGPSMAVDSMCASSLTTVHLACQSLRAGECQVALAGGVNVSIHPSKFLMLGAGKFASRSGRCESFGAGASGYVPSEGVGAVLLKPLAQALRDGDRIHGVIRGSAVNHGGRTNGYSVPSAAAQAAVIGRALREAAIDPRQIGYVEAHGTGTVLGDPIEVAGLTSAWQAFTSQRQFCALGSVKSNIGHCESAAGIAGLTKVLLQMKHGLLVPSLHAGTANPNIDFTSTPFRLQRSLTAWERPIADDGKVARRMAAISSFGAGGSNAHLVVSEAPLLGEADAAPAATNPVAVPLSARSAEALGDMAVRLLAWLGSAAGSAVDLRALAYTLQVGREAWEWRLALRVTDIDALRIALEAFIAGRRDIPGCWAGSLPDNLSLSSRPDEQTRRSLEQGLREGDLDSVLRRWVDGVAVDWSPLYPGRLPARIGLPTYPFARQRYWAPDAPLPQQAQAQAQAPLAAPSPGEKIRLRALAAISPTTAPTATLEPREVKAPTPDREACGQQATDPMSTPAAELELDRSLAEFLRQSLAAMLYCEPQQIREGSRFLDLGLDSVVAAQWIREINRHTGLKLPAGAIYDYPVFKAFAQWVQSESSASTAPLLPESSTSQAPCTAAVDPGIAQYLRQSLGELLFLDPGQIRSGARFLDLGLDSVTGTQWMRAINRHFSLQLAADAIYTWPTLQALAAEIGHRLGRHEPPQVLLDAILDQVRSGSLPLDSACAVVEDTLRAVGQP
ncbi:hypothetical protein NS383_01830 [Pseudomonas oryzihabitans]|nr:hypothetical protein NS383_01830 [Pseudomonas psychrotolerans]